MLNKFSFFAAFLLLCGSGETLAQVFTRQTYHDREKKKLKEVYQVKDTLHNVLNGRYISYYLSGNIESKGQFTNNETSGVWEFLYENGNIKMRGILFKGANYGMWEYFNESGQKTMEGIINGRDREGEWKMYYENGQLKEIGEYSAGKRKGLWKYYFEDGTLKGEIDYSDDFGTYTEYYHSGKILATGPRNGTRNVGHWRFFADDATLQSEGEFANGKKNGEWINYYSSGKMSSRGKYENDEHVGKWEYFFEDGTVSSAGEYVAGQKTGYWGVFHDTGKLKSEITYQQGTGEYREYYPSGRLKMKGKMVKDKKEEKWEYYYEDGKKEGECTFIRGKGTYHGYYPNGNLQTKGVIEDDLKTGTWEIYENDGKLSGYYRPFYDNQKLGKEIAELAGKSTLSNKRSKAKRFTYFDPRFNEFQGVIFGSNPVWLAAGQLPLSVEFYLQERLGHEFEFIGIRDPFFKEDLQIARGRQYKRGYSISIKQKLYNPLKVGMWYFGQEIRFTNLGHFVNTEFMNGLRMDNVTLSATEQRIEWGALLGYRIIRHNNVSTGFTIDTFISGDIGYRGFSAEANAQPYFQNISRSKLSTTFHFGLNLGNVFSFR